MAWARLAITAAFFALLTVAASAQGYPSYESRGYGGPLYIGPNFHSNDSGGSYQRSAPRRVYRETPRHEAPVHRKTSTAKSAPADDDADKVKDKADNENSGIARGSLAKTDTDTKADTAKGEQNENSTITRASLDKDTSGAKTTDAGATKPATEPKTTQNVGCKKYFPAVGMTLSVPCE
jgi:hypothetical protein